MDERFDPAHFFACLCALRLAHLFSVTSYFRTAYHNRVVGGDPVSKHLYGLAVDVVLDPGEHETVFLADAETFGLTAVKEHGWIHLQALPKGTPVPSPEFPLSRPALPTAEHEPAGVCGIRYGQDGPAAAPEGGQTQGGVPLSEGS